MNALPTEPAQVAVIDVEVVIPLGNAAAFATGVEKCPEGIICVWWIARSAGSLPGSAKFESFSESVSGAGHLAHVSVRRVDRPDGGQDRVMDMCSVLRSRGAKRR